MWQPLASQHMHAVAEPVHVEERQRGEVAIGGA